MRGQVMDGLMWLFLMIICWAILFASGAGSFYGQAINATLYDATVPSYFKTGLEILPAVMFIALIYTFTVKIQGRERTDIYQ